MANCFHAALWLRIAVYLDKPDICEFFRVAFLDGLRVELELLELIQERHVLLHVRVEHHLADDPPHKLPLLGGQPLQEVVLLLPEQPESHVE
eukprot:scaffold126823_cov31-Prasinocladus_malaysianus.AAC.1